MSYGLMSGIVTGVVTLALFARSFFEADAQIGFSLAWLLLAIVLGPSIRIGVLLGVCPLIACVIADRLMNIEISRHLRA